MSSSRFGYQCWRSLLFLHWQVAAADLKPLLPRGLTLDLHDGTAYVGVVPFAMEGVRPSFLPEALSFPCLEVNLRTYVLNAAGEPGVYFFSLDANSIKAVLGGRFFYGLPYHLARMRLHRDGAEGARYESRRVFGSKHGLTLLYKVGEAIGPAEPGTLRHFLIERYTLFVARQGKLRLARVRHAPYELREVSVHHLEGNIGAAAGIRLEGPPILADYSPGVDVEVYRLEPA